MDNSEANDNKNKTKLVICIIIIIIIILLLITSCTSSYWGKIGKVLGFTEIEITDTTNDKKVILNKDLSFEKNKYVITTDDISYKILYVLENLRDKGVSCSTSNANIATCVAKDGYVIINPKEAGEVIIYAEMEANGNIYQASTNLEIKEGKTGIKLSSYEGSIYLSNGKNKSITYNLSGIKGDIKVTVDDEDIATAKASGGVLKITGKNPGKTKVTLEVEYLGRKYKAVYTINVYEKPSQGGNSDNTTKKPNGGTTGTTKKPNGGTTNPTKKPTTAKPSSKLQLNITAKNMVVGDTYTIKVTKGKATSWKSSDSSIVSVDKNGKVTALKPGKVTITATDKDGNKATVTIVVTAKPSTGGIKLSTSSKTIPVGSTFTPSYTGGTPAKWESSDPTIATVDKNGKITAKKPGTTVITVTDKNGNKDTIKITVTPKEIASKPIKVAKSKIEMYVGEEQTVAIAQGTPTKWESKDSSIASVDKNGKIVAKKVGKTTITVYDKDGNKATVEVTVKAKPTADPKKKLQLSVTSKEMIVGEEFKPGVIKGTPTSWTTSDSKVVTVDKNGNIIAVGKGTATVTAKDKDGNTAIIKITVKDLPLKLSESNITLTVGDKKTIGVIQGSASKWTVSPSGIISVNNKGEIVALKPGKATITVTDEYGNKEIVNVTVIEPVKKNLYLEDLIVAVSGEENDRNIGFDKEKDTYNITVDSDIDKDKITIIGIPEDKNNKVTYKYDNGKEVRTLDGVKLTSGKHTVEVIVTAPDGSSKSYKVNITKEPSDNTDITVKINGKDGSVTEDNSVSSNTDKIKLDIDPVDPRTKITKIDGKDPKEVDLNNYPLKPGRNEIKVTVVAEDGTEKTHTIVINKAERKIQFSQKDDYEFDITNAPYTINYEILEDGVPISNLTKDDIKGVSITIPGFKGTVEVDQNTPGKVVITPTLEDVGTHTIQASYNGTSDSRKITITAPEYYISTPKDIYNAVWNTQDKDLTTPIIINTNILSYDESGNNYTVDKKAGVITVTNNNGDKGVVKIKWDSSIADLEFEKNKDGSESYVLRVKLKKPEDFKIDVEGSIYGNSVDSFPIEVRVIEKFILLLDARDGVLNSLENKTFEYFLNADEEFNLLPYEPYKVDDTKNCYVFPFIEWVDADNNTIKYPRNSRIKITKNTTLYATYDSTSKYDEISTQSYIDLIELDLFNSVNEMYEPENLIYPGLEGAHTVRITNSTGGVLKIKQFTLQEETLCIAQHQCLNMGYAIRSVEGTSNKYYYGGPNIEGYYNILNKDADDNSNVYESDDTPFKDKSLQGYYSNKVIDIKDESDYIEIAEGAVAEIDILWKWVEIDDDLDTKIGQLAVKDNRYILNVRVGFDKTNKYCTLTETPKDDKDTTTKQ